MRLIKKTFLGVFFTILLCPNLFGWENESFVSATADPNKAKALWEDIKSSDMLIRYSPSGKTFDIGVGELKNGLRSPILFSINELEYFFNEQNNKNFIVILIEVSPKTQKTIQKSVVELKDYFNRVGYKRILVLGAHATGMIIYCDFYTMSGT